MRPAERVRETRPTPHTVDYAEFRTTKYFPQLDGLRGISILLVLTYHSHLLELRSLNGHTGVTVFFVISGFIITTLLLREGDASGRVDLPGFYVRRVFRLLPLYLIALGATALGVALGFAANPGDFGTRLVYFLTFTNEFAPPGTFGHSWSLAVEEKFYFLWPLLAFIVPMGIRVRIAIAVVLASAASVIGLLFGDVGYFGVYAPILFGCLLALVAHDAGGYRLLQQLVRPLPGALLTVGAVFAIWAAPASMTQVVVGAALFLAFPFMLFGAMRRPLSARWLVWAGKRAYAVYLFHLLVGGVVSQAVPPVTPLSAGIHLVLMAVLSLALAEALYRLVELPLIRVGHRLTRRTPR